MNRLKIAVLLAAYNGTEWLPEQIASVFRQCEVDITLFISVDRSTDGTEALVDSLAAIDKRIKVLPHGESFGGAAKNFFRLIKEVELIEFDYVSFADQDDIWDDFKLANAAKQISKHNVDAYSSSVTAFWADGRKVFIDKSQPQVKYDFLFEAAGPGCTYVFSRALMTFLKSEILKNWDEIQRVTLHDWFCYALARSHGYRWYIDSFPTMLYRQHQNNQVGINRGLKAIRKRASQITDGWWLSQSQLIANIIGMSGDPFVGILTKLTRVDLLLLSMRGYQCRRRYRDKVAFSIFCLVLICTPRLRK